MEKIQEIVTLNLSTYKNLLKFEAAYKNKDSLRVSMSGDIVIIDSLSREDVICSLKKEIDIYRTAWTEVRDSYNKLMEKKNSRSKWL